MCNVYALTFTLMKKEKDGWKYVQKNEKLTYSVHGIMTALLLGPQNMEGLLGLPLPYTKSIGLLRSNVRFK